MLNKILRAKLLQALGETPFGTVKKFYRIKIGREVVHGKAYAHVSKRNSYIVVYKEEQGEAEYYGQIQYNTIQGPHCCHRVTGSCHFCEPSSFGSPDGSAEFADSKSDIAVYHVHTVKKPRYALYNRYM